MGRLSRGDPVDCNVRDCIEENQSQFEFTTPSVNDKSLNIYQTYVDKLSMELVASDVISKYRSYVNNEFGVFR